jgi:hypothetical protein
MQSEVFLGSPHFDHILVLGAAWKREMECVVQGVETPQEGVLGMIRDQRPLFCDRTV